MEASVLEEADAVQILSNAPPVDHTEANAQNAPEITQNETFAQNIPEITQNETFAQNFDEMQAVAVEAGAFTQVSTNNLPRYKSYGYLDVAEVPMTEDEYDMLNGTYDQAPDVEQGVDVAVGSGLDPESMKQYMDEVAAKELALRKVKRNAYKFVNNADREENLGDNFENTPWLPPSIEKARMFKANNIYRGGLATLSHVHVCSEHDLGTGVAMYFQFLKSIAICTFFMSLLCFPQLLFSYYGTHISDNDKDPLGSWRYTFGNIGYNPASATYATDSNCTETRNLGYSGTCIHFAGHELQLETVANTLTAMEMLQAIVFLITLHYLWRKMVSVKDLNDRLECQVSDYSVMVTGLPPDTTEEQLLTHFTNLYPLDKKDWMQRPPIKHARPVQQVVNGAPDFLVNTWVAGVVIHTKIGKLISAFLEQQALMATLYRCRAEMKKYADGTPYYWGANPSKWKKAENKLIEIGSKIDSLADAITHRKTHSHHFSQHGDSEKSHHISQRDSAKDAEGSEKISEKTVQSTEEQAKPASIAAFITFEYSESMARCVEDYERYKSFPRNLCVPDKLKFRGTSIRVVKAPEPDEIMWENLEITKTQRFMYQSRNNIIVFAVMIICFAVIVQVCVLKAKYQEQIPPLEYCTHTIPETYGYSSSAYVDYANLELTRPDKSVQESYDAQCAMVLPNSFYAVYVDTANSSSTYKHPVFSYDLAACTSSSGYSYYGECPQYGQSVFCPCLDMSSSESCSSLECSTIGTSSTKCLDYSASLIGYCYCSTYLKNLILNSGGVTSAIAEIRTLDNSNVCYDFLINYSKSNGITYVAVLATIVVNFFLQVVFIMLTKSECQTSVDKYQASLMFKIFIATLFNMGLVIILAAGKITSTPEVLRDNLRFFDGIYDDFNSAWFGNIGSFLLITFCIQVVSSCIPPLLNYCVFAPLTRCWYYPSIRRKTSVFSMQHDVNQLEVGPVFDATISYANIMALLFFAMIYAPGIPLLIPLTCITCTVLFYVDKLLLCRYYQRPPHVAEGTIKLCIQLLYYVVVVRLAVAAYMFGNQSILESPYAGNSVSYGGSSVSSNYLNEDGGETDVKSRLQRKNTVPIVVLLVVIAVTKVLYLLYRHVLVYNLASVYSFFNNLCKCCFSGFMRQSKVFAIDDAGFVHGFTIHQQLDPLRQETAPFTGEYQLYLRDKDEIPTDCCSCCDYDSVTKLTELEVEEGWLVEDETVDKKYVVKVKKWKKKTITDDGFERKVGETKRTYEIILDHGCNSYDVSRIPTYRMAMKALSESQS